MLRPPQGLNRWRARGQVVRRAALNQPVKAGQRRAQASTIAQIKVTTAVMGAMVARVDNGSRCLGQTLTELPLIEVLPREQRTFIKPLKYDARSAAAFPNVLLLDSGKAPLPLHVASPLAEANERALKASLVARCPLLWVWYTNQGMPPLPERTRYEAGGRVLHSSSQDGRVRIARANEDEPQWQGATDPGREPDESLAV